MVDRSVQNICMSNDELNWMDWIDRAPMEHRDSSLPDVPGSREWETLLHYRLPLLLTCSDGIVAFRPAFVHLRWGYQRHR